MLFPRWVSPILPPESVRADERAYADIVTKFPCIDRFPISVVGEARLPSEDPLINQKTK